jgi:hypothetical protein
MDNSLNRSLPSLGNLEGVYFLELSERQMKKGSGNRASLVKLFWAFCYPGYVRRLRSHKYI